METPLVSVVTITYNHEPWIAKTIEGVLAQKVDFPIEYIIAEDCSTDGTREICERYAENYPAIINLLDSEKNLGFKENEKRAMEKVRGKYIAFCEGDDYWTCPDKLQRQVDFLEANPDYSVCFTRFKNYNAETDSEEPDYIADLFDGNTYLVDLSMELFFSRWCTQPLTMVYRADAIPLNLYDKYEYYRDQHQIYHLLKVGKGCILNFESGIRVKHYGGMASMIDIRDYCERVLPLSEEFYRLTKDTYPKKLYVDTLQESIRAFSKDYPIKTLRNIGMLLFLGVGPKRVVKNFFILIFTQCYSFVQCCISARSALNRRIRSRVVCIMDLFKC